MRRNKIGRRMRETPEDSFLQQQLVYFGNRLRPFSWCQPAFYVWSAVVSVSIAFATLAPIHAK